MERSSKLQSKKKKLQKLQREQNFN